ncbi:MAG: S8 family peptidase [Bacteroidota bacterium]
MNPNLVCLPPINRHQIIRNEHGGASLKSAFEKSEALEEISWAQRVLKVHKIWWQTEGEGIKVAVLDTGIDPSHPDLKSAIVDMKDFTGSGIKDTNGHGTHCAGIIAARRNMLGFIGVAPKAELLIAKVLDNEGNGSHQWIADGINWAVENGADIISMSLGTTLSAQVLFESIHNALAKGIHVICAAGNEGSLQSNNIAYPGRYGGVITVGSHDFDGMASGFSSRGGEVDFVAPGSNIWSSYTDGGYAELSGTSMATPFVAGVAALILAKHKKYKNKTEIHNCEDLKNHLLRMAAHPGYHDNRSGYGPLMPFRYFGT